jgi:hypothetical protein
MEPVGLEIKNGKELIIHKCVNCEAIKNCKVSKEDNRDVVLEISLSNY